MSGLNVSKLIPKLDNTFFLNGEDEPRTKVGLDISGDTGHIKEASEKAQSGK